MSAAPVSAAPVNANAARVRPLRGLVGGIEYFALGEGEPVTVFVHGLAGSVAETRPLASQLAGTRVLLHLRGHGASRPLPAEGWDYPLFAEDLLRVSDAVGATRAVGLSVGAGALLHLLTGVPERFHRVAFVLPAGLDQPREDAATARLALLGQAMTARDLPELTRLLMAEAPAVLRGERAVRALASRRAQLLAGMAPPWPRGTVRPIADLAVLGDVTVPALVVGQRGDPLHPARVARQLCAALPAARLLMLPAGGVFWTARDQVQRALAAHCGTWGTEVER
ncbi:MAG: alpha/beta fold hydrolase [Mycobacteriales bacterium]